MFRRGFSWLRLLVVLILAAGLVAAGFSLYRAGQAQGYAAGLAQAGGEEMEGARPYLPAFPGYYGPYLRPYLGFGPFGLLLGLFFWGGLFFLFIGLLRSFLWRRHWGGPHGWHGGWRRSPPWAGTDPESGKPGNEPRSPEVL